MAVPAAIAHGGAGPGPSRQTNVEVSISRAVEILEAGGSAVEAAVEACVVLEDDPVFNAGTGAVYRTDGSVLLDASLQTSDGRMGFVIAMCDTPNPIRVGRSTVWQATALENGRIQEDIPRRQSKVGPRAPSPETP